MNALALYQYTDKEIKDLLSTLTVLVDTREQMNQHVIQYFDSKKIPYKVKKNDTADCCHDSKESGIRDCHGFIFACGNREEKQCR